jgi:GTP-binding protein HflX
LSQETKATRLSLVAQQQLVASQARTTHHERAVLVAVEFTGERRKLSAAARLARGPAFLLNRYSQFRDRTK